MGRGHAEHRMYHCHHDGRGNPLATHVADAEEQLLVADKEVVEVATHFAGSRQRTEDIDIVAPQTERTGQHLLLDIRRDT